MKKLLGLLTLLTVFGLVGLFAPMGTADAGCTYRCTLTWHWANPEWGMGSTCAEAAAQGIANSENWAYNQCDVCEFGAVEEVTPCTCVDGMCKGDWRVAYRCGFERCLDPYQQ